MDDLQVRYGARKDVRIGDRDDKINLVTTIENYDSDIGIGQHINGYKINFDINTWQHDIRPRFRDADIREFAEIARQFQKELREDIII